MSIDIPKNMKLKMKHGKLQNGINYVVIKDSDATVANVGIGIKVGSMHDPIDNMGLAHFLEHMLFLGSKKYKEESYFDTMVKQYGGSSNAYTASFETVYHFDVLAEHLNEILDIFSRFFIDPLFDINSVSREINAINSEHMKNINNEFWIIRQLIRDISDNDGVMHRFTTGSHDTFSKDYNNLRKRMVDFYNKYYCSNNLYIVIQSNMDIINVENMISKYFSIIENKKCTLPNLSLYPKFSVKNKEYQLIPSNDNEFIVYFWDLYSMHHYNDNNIIDVINHIIMMRCENNLYDILIQTLCVISIEPYYIEDGVFTIKVNIIKNMKTIDNIKRINNIIANYFNNLGRFNWNKLYDQMEIMYRFIYDNERRQENGDVMMDIVTNMMYYKVENIYNGDKLILKKDYEMLGKTIKMLEFKNASIIYGTEILLDKGEFIIEPYYNKKYKPLKYGFIRYINMMDYHNYNVVIDTDVFKVKPALININIPVPIKLNKNNWYGGISSEPFARVDIIMRNDMIFNTIESSIISNIAINIINYYISIYFCQYFNVDYNIQMTKNNNMGILTLSISGYNDKFMDFVKMVILKIKTIKPNDNIILLYKNKYKDMLDKKETQTAWSYADMVMDLIYPYNYHYKDQLRALAHIDVKNIYKRINSILKMEKFNITSLWYGNINEPYNLIETNDDIKYKTPLPKSITEITSISQQVIDDNSYEINITHPNKNEKNNCVTVILPCTNYSKAIFIPYDNATIMILAAILQQPVYGDLRTKNQLGYMVGSYAYYDNINMYIIIKVQSDKDINLVKSKIYNFIETFKDTLINYEVDKFNKIKKSVYDKLLEPYANMNELNMNVLYEIKKEKYIFDRKEQIAKEIENIKLNDIIKLYHSIIKEKKSILIITG